MNFGKTILDLRKKKNVTQEEMAAELGVTAAAVSKWENGYTLPDILMLCALADYFNVTTDELLARNKEIKYAVVVTASPELGKKIEQKANEYGFQISGHFDNYRDALSYAMDQEHCKHIFIGLPDTLTMEERDATPQEISACQSLGDSDDGILNGFDMFFRHMLNK